MESNGASEFTLCVIAVGDAVTLNIDEDERSVIRADKTVQIRMPNSGFIAASMIAPPNASLEPFAVNVPVPCPHMRRESAELTIALSPSYVVRASKRWVSFCSPITGSRISRRSGEADSYAAYIAHGTKILFTRSR